MAQPGGGKTCAAGILDDPRYGELIAFGRGGSERERDLAQTRKVLAAAGGRPGHIFNLGHGVLPELDPAILEKVVELVHAEGSGGSSVA